MTRINIGLEREGGVSDLPSKALVYNHDHVKNVEDLFFDTNYGYWKVLMNNSVLYF